MSREDRNEQRMREAWDRWASTRGEDLDMWDDYVTDDFRLRSLAEGDDPQPYTAPASGRQEMRRYLEGLTGAFAMDFWHLDETIASGDVVVGLGRTGWTNRDTGKSFETRMAMITRWRDGRMYEYNEFYDTAKIAATFS